MLIAIANKIIKCSDHNTIESAEGMHFKGLAMDPSKIEERLYLLKESYEIVSQLPDSLRKNRLLARIMTSYGSEMTKPQKKKELNY